MDGTESLIDNAKSKNHSESLAHITYQQIVDWSNGSIKSSILDSLQEEQFQTAVFNFCLYKKDGLEKLLKAIGRMLAPNGWIIIQTLHLQAISDLNRPNKNQWLDDSWQGLNGRFKNGHP